MHKNSKFEKHTENCKMYASVNRGRNNVTELTSRPPPPTIQVRSSNPTVRTPSSARTVRTFMPTVRSKFTERKTSSQPLAHATTHRVEKSNSNSQQPTLTSTHRNINVASAANERKKPAVPGTNTTVPRRIWGRNVKEAQRNVELNSKACEKLDPSRFNEMGIQTNELEIVDYNLLIGDIKFMLPSKMLVNEINRNRDEMRKKVLLKTQRKYEEHSEKQAEHLSDLKEFLERATITKKLRKPRETLELDHKLINSMDEIINREVPKTESITDIKSRIKRKERELLTLFETVENIQIFSNKNS